MKALRKAKIFRKYLAIKYDKPVTIFLACLLPFAQAFISSILVIYTSPERNSAMDNFILLGVSMAYFVAFVANVKRSANGSNLGLWLLVIFGAIGVVVGKIVVV